MNKNKIILSIVLIFILIVILIIGGLFLEALKLFNSKDIDTDYQKLGLVIEDYDIEYYTVYYKDIFSQYKVYKIKNYYEDSMKEFKEQLENNKLWNKNKFYEYIMIKFYEKIENDYIYIDRDNLYYYHKKDIYAIFDIKNAKLYYLEKGLFEDEKNYNSILGIKINNYNFEEIYSVRCGPQNDGTDYYVYKFNQDKGNEINNELKDNQYWSKEKLNDNILNSFKYNEEVKLIENAYYHYEKVCRTSDLNKKYNFTDEEATGYEVAVYDYDNNILYYYWTSI